MIMDSSMISAFESAAGISASHLSLVIRTLVLVGVYLWAIWIIYSTIRAYQHNMMDDIFMEFKKFGRVLVIVTLATVLVFIA